MKFDANISVATTKNLFSILEQHLYDYRSWTTMLPPSTTYISEIAIAETAINCIPRSLNAAYAALFGSSESGSFTNMRKRMVISISKMQIQSMVKNVILMPFSPFLLFRRNSASSHDCAYRD